MSHVAKMRAAYEVEFEPLLCPDDGKPLSHVSVWIDYRYIIVIEHDGERTISVGESSQEIPDDSEEDWFECVDGCGRRFPVEEVMELVGIKVSENDSAWDAVKFS